MHTLVSWSDERHVTNMSISLSFIQRRKQSSARRSVRKEKALSPDDIAKALKTYCCQEECLKKVISKEDMLKCRKDFRSLSEEDQRAFLLKFFTFRVYHHKGIFNGLGILMLLNFCKAELETDTFYNKCSGHCCD